MPENETDQKYGMVYRCHYQGLDPFGCSWSTLNYAEIDGHEDQLDPGHFVMGEMERLVLPPGVANDE